MDRIKASIACSLIAATSCAAFANENIEKDEATPNFTYSRIGVFVGEVENSETDSEGDVRAFSLSSQAFRNLAFSFSHIEIESKDNGPESTIFNLSLDAPVPLGKRADIIFKLGYQKVHSYSFAGFSSPPSAGPGTPLIANYTRSDDSTATYGAAARIWLLPDILEFSASHMSVWEEDSDSANAFTLSGWVGDHNSLSVNYTEQGDFEMINAGYSFNW